MSLLIVASLLALPFAAAVRMLVGHWMPIQSEPIELDFRSMTFADIPVEELYGESDCLPL